MEYFACAKLFETQQRAFKQLILYWITIKHTLKTSGVTFPLVLGHFFYI